MADSVIDDASIVANDDDLDRILSHSDAIIGSLDKLDGEVSIHCNGTSTIDLTDIDCGISTGSGFSVNNGLITPGVSNAAVGSQNRVVTLTTCVPCVVTDSSSVAVRTGVSAVQLVSVQTPVQAVRTPMQPNRLMPPPPTPVCGQSTAVVNGRLPSTGNPSSIVTMLMRPSASGPGTAATQMRLGVGRSPAGATVPVSSVQVVNVGVASRSEPRLVAVSGGVMPAGVRFIQSSPQQPLQQPQLQPQQQVIAFEK